MKKYILISLLSLIPLSGWAQKTEDENWNKIISEVINNKEFRVQINQVTPRRGRTFHPTTPYNVRIQNDSIFSYLPYMGRATSITYGGGEGLNFKAPLRNYEAKLVKNKRISVVLNTKSKDDTYRYSFSIYPNGKTTIDVQGINRESISFMGEIVGSQK